MTERHEIPLDLTTFEALDSALKYHRTVALVSPEATAPMEAFQADLVATANRLGFHPAGAGTFHVQVQPGGRNLLVWEPTAHEVQEVAHGCEATA
ncbi:hypothetical protein NS376_16030 [Pseudomonas oryzihabitans]|nr:hypothetical protein NS376_16030 [Pseudomonas psychrotolerans]